MAALITARNTPRKDCPFYAVRSYLVGGGANIIQGSLVCLDAGGVLVSGYTATGLRVVGRAMDGFDNTAGGGGIFRTNVESGTFRWENDGLDALVISELGDLCYITDDQTVCASDGVGTKSGAGYVCHIESSGVWVTTPFPLPSQ